MTNRRALWTGVAMGMAFIGGCTAGNPLELPGFTDTELVTVSETESIEADLGSGVAALARTTWVVRKAEDDSLLFRLRYGESGELVELFDNFVLAQPWLGERVDIDAQLHDTAFAGGHYLSAAYIAEQDNRVGVLVVFHGIYLGLHVGTARATFSSDFTPGADRVEGTFTRTLEIFGTTPFVAPADAEFEVYAVRES